MFQVNCRLNDLGLDILGNSSSETDVIDLVPMDVIRADEGFVRYNISKSILHQVL